MYSTTISLNMLIIYTSNTFLLEELVVCFIDSFEYPLGQELVLVAESDAVVGMHYKHRLPVL